MESPNKGAHARGGIPYTLSISLDVRSSRRHNITNTRKMDSSDPLRQTPFINSSSTKTKERSSFNQLMPFKASPMTTMMQAVQKAMQKSYIRACQLFCLPLDPLMCEKVMCCSAKTHQPKEKNTQALALQSPPSTILIVNISNSTLIDCVIGNDTHPSAAAIRQPLMQEPERHMRDQMRFSCGSGQQEAARTAPVPPLPPSEEHQSISIHSSHLSYAIIGDNNSMHVEMSQPFI